MKISSAKTRKGFVTIFVMLFFVSMISLFAAFVKSSKVVSVNIANETLGNLWCNSILAEYDKIIQSRYNIFAFYGLPSEIEKKLNYYAGYSYKNKKYIDYRGCKVDLYDYSMSNPANIKCQILESGRLCIAGKIIKEKAKNNNKKALQNGKIKNEKILNSLPSKDFNVDTPLYQMVSKIQNAKSFESILKNEGESGIIISYINTYFKSMGNSKDLGETFFQNEEEYIICGKKSDEENKNDIMLKFIGVREALNAYYAFKDPKMSAESLAAAEIITPGPAASLTQKGLLMTWALAESYNDYKLVITGEKIPMIKTSKSWAVDLESVLNNEEGTCINPHNTYGQTYEDYLNFFLYCTDENVKLLRLMDLIQINLKFIYDKNFDLKFYNCGLSVFFKVNGDDVNVKRNYEKRKLYS